MRSASSNLSGLFWDVSIIVLPYCASGLLLKLCVTPVVAAPTDGPSGIGHEFTYLTCLLKGAFLHSLVDCCCKVGDGVKLNLSWSGFI